MAKSIPLEFRKTFTKDREGNTITSFLISIKDKFSDWSMTYVADKAQVERLRNDLRTLLGDLPLAEKLNITEEKAAQLSYIYSKDENCKECSLKESDECKRCFFETGSPLERILYRYMKQYNLYFETQVALDYKENIIYPEASKSGNLPYDQVVLFRAVTGVCDCRNGYRMSRGKV